MSKSSVRTRDSFIEIINEYLKAFIDYDTQKQHSKDKILAPLLVMADYVFQAKKAGLNQREQCSYAGSVLVFSSLKAMGLRYGSDVNKVNKIYLGGVKLANAIWSKLADLEDSSSKVSQNDFEGIKKHLSDTIFNIPPNNSS